MSIRYTITCVDDWQGADTVEWPLHVPAEGFFLDEADLTREISDGIADAKVTLTISPDHPYYDQPISLMRTTVYIRDGDDVIFRGRAVSEETDRIRRKRYVCEGDMAFLRSVPDVFSPITKSRTVYKIGSEKAPKEKRMTEIQTQQTPGALTPPRELTMFRENTSWTPGAGETARTVYRSAVTATEPDDEENGGSHYGDGESSSYSNYFFQAYDEGKSFTVELTDDGGLRTFLLPLKKGTYRATMYETSYIDYKNNGRTITGVMRYLGNLNLIAAGNLNTEDSDFTAEDFDPNEEVTGPPGTIATTVGALNFCIVDFDQAPHWDWWIHTSAKQMHWSIFGETVIYAAARNGGTLEDVSVRVYRNSATTVRAMAQAMLNDCRDAPAGYNRYVPEHRRIYRGAMEIDGEIENSSVASCYENIRKWLEQTGGYAKVAPRDIVIPQGETYQGEAQAFIGTLYFLDLMADSGERDDSFYVRLGDNLQDAKKDESCDGVITGVYPIGVWNGAKDGGEGSADRDEDYRLTLEALGAQTAGTAQAMTDEAKTYRFTGATERYYPQKTDVPVTDPSYHSGLYGYAGGKWAELPFASGEYPEAATAQAMTDEAKTYRFTGSRETYITGRYYRKHPGGAWEENTELRIPKPGEGFTLDTALGVIWNDEARGRYGEIVGYLEINVSDVKAAARTQYLTDKSQEEIRTKLTAYETLEVSACDPRLIDISGGRLNGPVLGNYYPVETMFGETDYKRLTKIVTDFIRPSRGKLVFGEKKPRLSGYVKKKGERL